MKTMSKLTGAERHEVILKAVRKVFVEKGFHAATTRELARAAGVSEALLYKHFPSKKALYSAIQHSYFGDDRANILERLKALKPSTANLVFLLHFLYPRMFDKRLPGEGVRSLVRLMLQSLMNEGEFARTAFKEGPLFWVRKVQDCMKAAIAAGDVVDGADFAGSGAWFAHHLSSMIFLNLFHAKPIVDYGASKSKLRLQAVLFTLRGMGLKEKAIKRYYNPKTLNNHSF
jgi:AcrR family transcriptional regulator